MIEINVADSALNKMVKLKHEIRELSKRTNINNLESIDKILLIGIQEKGDRFAQYLRKRFLSLCEEGNFDKENKKVQMPATLYADIEHYAELLEFEKSYYIKSFNM